MKADVTKPQVYVEETDSYVDLPCHKEVCPRCDGEGTTWGGLSFTESEVDEYGRDEFMEALAGKRFDRPCEECGGLRVVDVPDEDRTDPEVWKQWLAQEQAGYELRAAEAAERMAGC